MAQSPNSCRRRSERIQTRRYGLRGLVPAMSGIAAVLIPAGAIFAGDTCDVPPPPATNCIGACADSLQQCVPTEILADSSGNFITITCCECQAPACHVAYDPAANLIYCEEDCPVPPPGDTCTLLAKGNMDGTITYACECIHPADPHVCEPTSECNPCLPGSCTTRCPGPCPDVNDPCLPTTITEFPPNSGNFTLTGCDCNPVCRPIVNAMGVVECIDQCPDGITPCPSPVAVPNGTGGIDYTCPPCAGSATTCPEPVGQTLCADLQATDCISTDPLNCMPTCVHDDGTGVITATSCDCRNQEDCHVVFGATGPYCDGVCPPGEVCVETVTDDGVGGTFICCDCLPCGPDPNSPTGCRQIECPNPLDECLPTCINDDGNGNFTPIDCDCRSPEECHAEPNPVGVGCVGVCPQGQECVRTETPDGMGGTDVCCECDCVSGPGACCFGRPTFADPAYASFDGAVAVVTASPGVLGGGHVVTVFDIEDLSGDPLNADFPIDRYSDPSWTGTTGNDLGSVFGIALDKGGNIYVTASTSYSLDNVGFCGWGGVYRLDAVTGTPTCFANLPNTGPGLGNIAYDCAHDQFFVTNFDDGKIYRLDANGNNVGTFDHGLPGTLGSGFAPRVQDPNLPGERPWAVAVHDGRVFYGIWREDNGLPSAAVANEIWSVPLLGSGAFGTNPTLEILLPPNPPNAYNPNPIHSNPPSDIRFTPEGYMLVAEHGMRDDTTPDAHRSRLLEFQCGIPYWVPTGRTFSVGLDVGGFWGANTAGGVDRDYRPAGSVNGRVWATGDYLQGTPSLVYGFQGLPAAGGDVAASYLIDYNGLVSGSDSDKTRIGDIEVSCPCDPPPDGMIAWWPMDETAPTSTALEIINSNHGTHMNAPTPTPGEVIGALEFDGVSQFVEVPDDATLDFGTGSFTIDAWVFLDGSAGSGGPIVQKKQPGTGGIGYEFKVTGSGLLVLTLESGIGLSAISSTAIPIGVWSHVAVVVTRLVSGNTTHTFYIDAQPAGSGGPTVFGSFSSPTVPLWIGRDFGAFFRGKIDEVELFNRDLTQGEIAVIYDARSRGKCKGCRPKPDLSSCLPFSCPGQFDYCLARDAIYDPNTGQTIVRRCDCGLANLWRLEIAAGAAPVCAGDCPPGFTCDQVTLKNPDGTIQVTCTLTSSIPTVSQWGLAVLTLLMLVAGTIVFARRRPAAAR